MKSEFGMRKGEKIEVKKVRRWEGEKKTGQKTEVRGQKTEDRKRCSYLLLVIGYSLEVAEEGDKRMKVRR